MHDVGDNEEVRLDKWLWAARFFKTRSLAAGAITSGKVEINGDRAKPGRIVRLGDKLNIRRGVAGRGLSPSYLDLTRRNHYWTRLRI